MRGRGDGLEKGDEGMRGEERGWRAGRADGGQAEGRKEEVAEHCHRGTVRRDADECRVRGRRVLHAHGCTCAQWPPAAAAAAGGNGAVCSRHAHQDASPLIGGSIARGRGASLRILGARREPRDPSHHPDGRRSSHSCLSMRFQTHVKYICREDLVFAVATWHRKRIKDGGCRDSVAPALYVRDTSQTTLWRHGLGTGNETGT